MASIVREMLTLVVCTVILCLSVSRGAQQLATFPKRRYGLTWRSPASASTRHQNLHHGRDGKLIK